LITLLKSFIVERKLIIRNVSGEEKSFIKLTPEVQRELHHDLAKLPKKRLREIPH